MSDALTVPSLSFTVLDVRIVAEAAVPTLAFRLRVAAAPGDDVRAVIVGMQLRLAVARRSHDAATRARLSELFGTDEQWSRSAQSLLWTHASVTVPAFTRETMIELPVACTHDMEIATAKYIHALHDGDIPVDFLFSGSVFYADPHGALQTSRIAWDREARFAVPVAMWREMLERYYPDSVWLRLDCATFDRLQMWKARQALPSWPMTIEALLRAADAERPA